MNSASDPPAMGRTFRSERGRAQDGTANGRLEVLPGVDAALRLRQRLAGHGQRPGQGQQRLADDLRGGAPVNDGSGSWSSWAYVAMNPGRMAPRSAPSYDARPRKNQIRFSEAGAT